MNNLTIQNLCPSRLLSSLLFSSLLFSSLLFFESNAQAAIFSDGKTALLFGGFRSAQGQAQNINMQNLIGDTYVPSDNVVSNVLLGVSHFFHPSLDNKNFSYGLSLFYFPFSTIKGNITQEKAFTNLGYRYDIQNIPLYATIKANMQPLYKDYVLTMDVSLGPNIITMRKYQENSLDEGVTLVNNAFKSNTTVALSAAMGIGIRFNHLIYNKDIEFAYKYFFLGKGWLDTAKSQVQTTLSSGASYAHALSVSVTI